MNKEGKVKTEPNADMAQLKPALDRFWDLAAAKALGLHKTYDSKSGSPVFTVNGKYTTRGWTEWTQGFQFGIPLVVFLATRNKEMLGIGRTSTHSKMAHHLTHFGVHDHGFNNLSTYGNLLRAANLGLFDCTDGEKEYYRLAIKTSGAVQARRWTDVKDGGFIYSFNGPHSLFIDTMRTVRILLASHLLGHRMMDEGDVEISLLERALVHGLTTARYAVYYGEDRDRFDIRGRTAHESIFNINDGNYRCPNSQQGYSGFTTWTRGLSWAMLGFTEFLEYLDMFDDGSALAGTCREVFLKAAKATCDFYMDHSAADGIPYWDTGAPNLHRLGRYQDAPADPFNAFEPVDSSAAAIAAQGFLRLGRYLEHSDRAQSFRYAQWGWKILDTLLKDTYQAREDKHEGILLHSVYHHPNGWDHIPIGKSVPCGESSMWGDYHMAELCYTAQQMLEERHYSFFTDLK